MGNKNTSRPEEGDFWVMKLSPKGKVEWQKIYEGENNDVACCIEPTSDGGYIIAGYTSSFGAGGKDIWILKLFPNGEIAWQKTFGDIGDDVINRGGIKQTDDGGYVVAGTIENINSSDDSLILKLSAEGEIEWQKMFTDNDHPYPSDQGATAVCQADDGGYIFVGPAGRLGVESDNKRYPAENSLIVKLGPDGNLQPCRYLGIPDVSVGETFIVPKILNFIMENIEIKLKDYQYGPGALTINVIPLCWKFNQPPENIRVESGINRSLFRKEAYITISWSPNSFNEGFNISEYRVYKRPLERFPGVYLLLGKVSGNTYSYVDIFPEINKKFCYVITSVDSDGIESAKSIPVSN